MWKVRDDEPGYAFLKESTAPEVNYYEAPIDLIARTGGALPAGREMFINEEPGVGAILIGISNTRFILPPTIA